MRKPLPSDNTRSSAKRFADRYPITVTTEKEAACEFWEQVLSFERAFDSIWFSLLVGENSSASISFMTPDRPSVPPGPEIFSGTGMCFELEVDDARAASDELNGKGLAIDHPLTDEPFSQRRFGFCDPAGLWVGVVEQLPPKAGFWDEYLV